MSESGRYRVLHICPNYPFTKLYHNLISRLEDIADNTVYVSQTEVPVTKDYPVIFTGRNFGRIDRLLYFRKQKCLEKDIEARGLIEGFDIIHAHTLFSAGNVACQLHKKYGIPYIVAVRNVDVNYFFHYMVHLRKKGLEVMEQAEAVIFISPAHKRKVLDQYVPRKMRETMGKKCCVIPNGIDDFYLKNIPQQTKRIVGKKLRLIYVGEVNANKNVTTTLKACEMLKSMGYHISFKVVGKISDSKLSYITDIPFVEYHQHCDKEELIKYYNESDIFVMPSINETFGLVYIEALSQGLPVVYSRGQGIDGYFVEGKVGYHVRSNHPEDIVSAVKQIISHYEEMTYQAIEESRCFLWRGIASQYEKIYYQIFSKQELKIMDFQHCIRSVMDNSSDTIISFDTEGH